jgi:hypothetical protein
MWGKLDTARILTDAEPMLDEERLGELRRLIRDFA